jgi:hypothetical protein
MQCEQKIDYSISLPPDQPIDASSFLLGLRTILPFLIHSNLQYIH